MFDLDGTLRFSNPSYVQFFLDYAVHLGVEDSPQRRHAAIRWVNHYWSQPEYLKRNLRLYNERNEEFWNDYSQKFLLAFGCDPHLTETIALEINRVILHEFKPVDTVADDVFPTLDYLKDHNYRLAIVTNREKSCQEQLDRLGLAPYFELTIVSGEINLFKPDKAIFKYTLDLMGITPDEAIYVGDNYFTDIIGAQQAGILPVLIDPNKIFPEAECPVISKIGDLLALD